jgi:hypothetical protein
MFIRIPYGQRVTVVGGLNVWSYWNEKRETFVDLYLCLGFNEFAYTSVSVLQNNKRV